MEVFFCFASSPTIEMSGLCFRVVFHAMKNHGSSRSDFKMRLKISKRVADITYMVPHRFVEVGLIKYHSTKRSVEATRS